MQKMIAALALTVLSTNSFAADYLEVIVNPPSVKLDWSTPAQLSRAYLSSAVKATAAEIVGSARVRSTVGHVMIHFNCVGTNNEAHDFYTGMSGQENQFKSIHQLLIDQSGLSVLFSPVDDGYIESDDEVRDLIYNHYARKDHKKNSPTIVKDNKFMRFKVSAEQCDQALEVQKAYAAVSFDEPKEHLSRLPPQDKLYFGFTLDAYQTYLDQKKDANSPLGGVCSSFAVAILKAAGVFDPSFDLFWKRSVEASIDLIGGVNPQTQQNYRISLKELLERKNSRWITPGIETKSVSIYEPELMWNFITGVQACESTAGNTQATTATSLCTPELMDWMHSQKSAVKASEVSAITSETEEKVLISGPKSPTPQYRVYDKDVTRNLTGIGL